MSNPTKTPMTILNSLVAVKLDVNIWSARCKLKEDDFTHAELPPEGLASLGSKKICNPKDLRIFGTIKARAVSLLERYGVRFLGGWAVPEKKVPEIMKILEKFAHEFTQEKNKFMASYDQNIQDWIANNTGWEQIIADSVVSASYVEKRIQFSWQMFKVAKPKQRHQQMENNGLNNEVENLGNTLFEEIAKSAKDTWNKSYKGKKDITRKALSPLRTMHSKLSDLAFIEPKVAPVADLIKAALDKVPSRGLVDGGSLLMLQGLVALLSDTKALLNYAQEMIDGRSGESVLSVLPNDLPLSSVVLPELEEAQPVTPALTNCQEESQKLQSMGLW